MDFEKIISFIKEICEKRHCILISVLYNFGKSLEEDNSTDNLSVYYILFQPTKETEDIYYCSYYIKEELEKFLNNKKISIKVECLEHYDNLKDRLSHIQNRFVNSFQVVYQLKTYIPPPKVQSKINKIGMDIKVVTDRIYSLEISYNEIKKITADSPRPFYSEDLFYIALKDNDTRFYDVKLLNTRFTEDGVIFDFAINGNKQYLQDSLNPSGKKQHVELLEAFEDENLNQDLDDMFRSIIELDEHTLEDKSDV